MTTITVRHIGYQSFQDTPPHLLTREAIRAAIRALRRAAPTEDRCATCGGNCGQC